LAYAHEQRGDMQRRGLLLVSLLQDGWPLGGALDRVGMTLPTHVKMAVAMHDRDPRMREVIPQAAEQRQLLAAIWSVYAERFVFLVVFLIAFTVIQLFLFARILPTYATLFLDFDLQLPIVTQWAIDISPLKQSSEDELRVALPLVLFILALLTLVVPIGFVIYFTGWVTWRPQMVQRWLFPLDMSFVYRVFAIGERQGIPLIDTLRDVSLEHPVPLMRQRVGAAGLRIEAGEEWISAFQKQHLLRPVDAAILRASQKAGNSNWVWDDIATAAHRRWSHRAMAIVQIVFPMVIAICGVMVGVTVYVYFVPLVKLIEGLS
ncbi:MAG: type II secretion system F family protein, partial [Planctomycetota bacterium]|nr:type II secretion system F family protein [Planctomycetota bacterium]